MNIHNLIEKHKNLTYSEVNKKVKEEKLFLHGWYYKIESGEIEYYDSGEKDFFLLG